jgi:predicted aspartyl protease
VRRSPVPGEAPFALRYLPNGTIVHNVTLGTMTDEMHVDAMIDTGATLCVVPRNIARALGFTSGNRLRQQLVDAVGGQVQMDIHRLEYVRVGSAKAYSVLFGVYNTFPSSRLTSRMTLVGLTFIRQFRTTFDFEENRVLFRARK